MTRFEYIAADARRMVLLLEIAHSDGLVAKGCSMDLRMPPTETKSWGDWLEEEYPEEWDDYDRAAELSEMERALDEAAMEAMEKKGGTE